ncbi:amidohydrolase family protein [Streptomyces sp. NPDC048278]|uniref:amidohydrolase family protein n=1 Tax=Streptomyces sp. NPDC048278 TaxID=3155809 RepID=UPI0034207BC3
MTWPAGDGSVFRELTVDLHAHLGVPALEPLIADAPGLARQRATEVTSLGPASAAYNRKHFGALAGPLTDLDLRLAAMDRAGVDVQAVSATPVSYAWAQAPLAERITEVSNQAVADHCALRPDRLVGIGTVALQHPELAVRQLRSAVTDLGLRGVQISTAAAPGVELDNPRLADFWAVAEEAGAAVFIHPFGCTLGDRLNAYYMFNTVGNPVETALALTRIAFSGLLERHPHLRIWAAHGGGYLPTYLGRADHAWTVREDARTTVEPPSAQLSRVFVDSLVYTPYGLRHLVEALGPDQVTLGTDYPFDMGVEDPVERLLAAGLDAETVTAVRGGNALRLLGPLPRTTPTPTGGVS